ncbi:uncharacterized protein K02A2.6-like [Hydractinia symbiolongicarpus]|uniref:uncharacterized protein K02A2.6-like n=1 Tax=Hydractinia symbiolongicarpus TaxID=13093 RepID=UPI00254CBB46|nr:uncharacterized protein K02A2.6-like [Hydractinia symbiolongicarpus]
MDRDIEERVKGCRPCQEHQNMQPKAPLHPWNNVTQPWTRLHLDSAGLFLGKVFLVLDDKFSKWIEAYPLNPNNYGSKATIECVRIAFATHGLPQICVTDNGLSFTSSEFDIFMKNNGIRHVTSAPYHPSTNGSEGRTVQSFKSAMKKMSSSPSVDSIKTRVNRFLFAYRTTLQITAEMSPAELLMNRKLTTKLSLIKPNLQRRLSAKRGNILTESAPTRSFSVGDEVWMRNYNRTDPKWLPGVIEAKSGPLSYHVHEGDPVPTPQPETQPEKTQTSALRDEIVPPQQPSRQPEVVETHDAAPCSPEVEAMPGEFKTPRRVRRKPAHLEDYDCST